MKSLSIPVVGIPCDVFERGLHPFHGVGEKYINAVAHGAHVVPLLIPGIGGGRDLESIHQLLSLEELVACLDGLFLTGSYSNVEPHHYDTATSEPEAARDPQRDATTLPLIRLAIDAGLPLLSACRGLQELNVALGGTLHRRVQELPGMMDHRENKNAPREEQYADAHDIIVEEGGVLASLLPQRTHLVNSLHGQGLDRLAPRLRVEARAPDGLVEAVSVVGSGFAVGVQWHPEWRFRESPLSVALYAAFGKAVWTRFEARR